MAWSRQSRHARGYGKSWDKIRARILARDKGLCQHCLPKLIVTAANQVDHIVPKAKPDTPDSGWRLAVKRGRDGKDAR